VNASHNRNTNGVNQGTIDLQRILMRPTLRAWSKGHEASGPQSIHSQLWLCLEDC